MMITAANVETLQSIDFPSLLEQRPVREVDGKMESYMNVMVDRDTGKILDIKKGMDPGENVVSAPITVLREDLGGSSRVFLALAEDAESDMSDKVRKVVQESFDAFNEAEG